MKVRKNFTLDSGLAERLAELPNQSLAVEHALRVFLRERRQLILVIEQGFGLAVAALLVHVLNGVDLTAATEPEVRLRTLIRHAWLDDEHVRYGLSEDDLERLQERITRPLALAASLYAGMYWDGLIEISEDAIRNSHQNSTDEV